jgi:hypothetical protein
LNNAGLALQRRLRLSCSTADLRCAAPGSRANNTARGTSVDDAGATYPDPNGSPSAGCPCSNYDCKTCAAAAQRDNERQ